RRMPVLKSLAIAAGEAGRGLAVVDAFWQWQSGGAEHSPRLLLERALDRGRLLEAWAPDTEAVIGLALAQLVCSDDAVGARQLIAGLSEAARTRGAATAAALALAWESRLELRQGDAGAALRAARAA